MSNFSTWNLFYVNFSSTLNFIFIVFFHYLHENCFMLIFFLVKLDACWLICKFQHMFFSCNMLDMNYFFKYIKVSSFMSSKNLLYFYFFFMKFTTCRLFLFVKLLHWFFSSWNRFYSWNFLCADYCSWDLIYLDTFLRETCCMMIYSFLKLYLWWYFSSWNLFYVIF